jgi:uncharacterized protein (DUF2336 family)
MPVSRSETHFTDFDDALVRCSSRRRADVLRQVIRLFVAVEQRNCNLDALDRVLVRLSRPAESCELVELSDAIARSGLPLPRVTAQLASSKDPEVVVPILKTSAVLPESLVCGLAQTRGQSELMAISCRSALSSDTTSALVMRGSSEVHRSVSRNHGARFSERALSVLLKLAERDEDLAEVLGGRFDISRGLIRKFMMLAEELPRARFVAAAGSREAAVELIALAGDPPNTAMPELDYDKALLELKAWSRSGRLGDAALTRFVLQKENERIVAALSILAELDLKRAQALFFCAEMEALALACKAARMRWATAASILQCRPGVSPPTEAELEQTRQLFERVSLSEAQRRVRYGDRSQNAARSATIG